ncbi:hypothetical protein PRIPAC_88616 [Pristionchus pacificus]|nr:hypothetical protein PRIPAC_88616 [Pristionchus pacificus]
MMRLLAIVLLVLNLQSSDSYKILVYNSKYGHSHSNYLGQIADTLFDAGHNVTSLIPIMDPSVRDGTEKSIKIHVQPDPEIKAMYEDTKLHKEVNFFGMNMANPLVPFFVGPMFSNVFSRTCKRVLNEPGLLERLREEKFDVMIVENFDVCGVGISNAVSPKSVIGVSSSALSGWHFSEWGVPEAVSYRPMSSTANLDVHSFLSRLYNLYCSCLNRLLFGFSRRSVNQALREHFGPEYPTLEEQSSNVAYVFTNSEPLIESAAPTMARVIDIGGIGAKQPGKLDEYWEDILTKRPKTVLLSFGSIAKSILIPPAMKTGIVKAIARIPDVTFIWKYEDLEDEFATGEASKVANLVLTKWMPQVDILAHPNLAAFITHGGMGSTQETALRGVPGIFIPIFADQPRNAGMMEFNGFGRVYDKNELHDDEKLAETIKEVLGNTKYRENAKRISAMLAKKPFKSRELLVKHVEFAAEFGPSAALRPQSIDMSFIEYNNLDILTVVLLVMVVKLYLTVKIVKYLGRKFVRIQKDKME